jgi:hypothetical protein
MEFYSSDEEGEEDLSEWLASRPEFQEPEEIGDEKVSGPLTGTEDYIG